MNRFAKSLLILYAVFAIPSTPVRADEPLVANHTEISVGDIGPQERRPDRPKITGHWGEDAVGFGWEESDSVDGRWNQTQLGPFLASVLPTPSGTIAKGLSIRLGDHDAAVCYDTHSMSCRVGWSGDFLKFDPARYGIIRAPQMAGDVRFVLSTNSWLNATSIQYRGLYQHGRRVVLAYDVDGVRVFEAPSATRYAGRIVFRRDFDVAPMKRDVRLALADKPAQVIAFGADQHVSIDADDQFLCLTIAKHDEALRFSVFMLDENAPAADDLDKLQQPALSTTDIGLLLKPGPLLWPAYLKTVGVVSADHAPYVIDTVTLPFNNPYRALMFVGGHDFFDDGRAALCTVHGDVWIVSGLDQALQSVTWKRFATGLHQPLGLKIVSDAIFVLGRDQITRLHDRDGNGEADFYECFNNHGTTSTGGHDYAAGLETDSQGNFYYVRAHTGLMKVAADGSSEEVIAAGIRNPAGLGIGPGDVITVSPQEGEWTPASAVIEARHGGWYGFGGPRVKPDRPLGYDPPLCWTPRLVDNSTGGQVWVTSDRWGPLQGQLLTMSFGRCAILVTLRDKVAGVVQGGNVPLDLQFESGLLRGRFHPVDGQLYVSGMLGWVSTATRDGCLQRVRYTGQKAYLPTAVRVYQNGISLEFTEPLDLPTAQDVDNYHLQQWNYRYAASYGSREYRVSQPDRPGRDEVEVVSATVADDGRQVWLEIADLQPVMQMKISYAIRAADGVPLRNSVYHTINIVPQRRLAPRHIKVATTSRPGRLDRETRKYLVPGLVARFKQATQTGLETDARAVRLAALRVPADQPPSPFFSPGEFSSSFSLSGYLRTRLKGDHKFWIDGPSDVEVTINGAPVAVGRVENNKNEPPAVALPRGYNTIEISGTVAAGVEHRFRLLWSAEDGPPEPIPPTALLYDSRQEELQIATQLRAGRELFAHSRCVRCHALPRAPEVDEALPELYHAGPDLDGLDVRRNANWVAHWIADPRSLRHSALMPGVLADTAEGRQEALDVTAFLMQSGNPASAATATGTAENDGDLIEAGLELYETRGCVACHRFTSPGELDEHDRISLHFANAKFPPGMLAEFLRQPRKHFATIRMPDFGLTAEEATAMAAYVRSMSTGQLSAWNDTATGNVSRGGELFAVRGCNRCHSHKGSELASAPYGTLFGTVKRRGCLSADDAQRGGAPRFGFDAEQRDTLVQFLRTNDQSLRQRAEGETAARLMGWLRCQACHDRDEDYSPLPDILADEGELGYDYDRLPNLVWAGEKLDGHWLKRLFAGELDYRSRPWLRMRMPTYPAYASLLASGLAAEHGVPDTEPRGEMNADLAQVGQLLTTKSQGLDCLQCHAIDDKFLVLENRSNGVGLSYTADRLRKEYYHRWIRDPLRIDPLTKMPKFSDDGIRSQRSEYFDGDAKLQFEALWHYLLQLEAERETQANGVP